MKSIKKLAAWICGTVKYCAEVCGAVAVNLVIMPSMVYATYAYMMWLGILEPVRDFGWNITREFSAGLFMMVLVKYIMVGITEEATFRYMLQDRALTKWLKLPKVVSLLLASLLFGAAHLGNGWGIPDSIPQSVGAAFAGVWFGYLYDKKGLHFAMLTHGLYDVVVVSLVMFT